MNIKSILLNIHEKVTTKMSKSKFVENVLIAKITDDDGSEYDCIYCTIIRNALLFGLLGGLLGFTFGRLI